MCKFCALYEMGFLGTRVGWRGSFLQRAAAHNSEQSTTEECLQCPAQDKTDHSILTEQLLTLFMTSEEEGIFLAVLTPK